MGVKFALIGGKVNKEILTCDIEKYLIDLSGKKNPTILFCPYAVKDTNKAITKFHNLCKNLDCNIIDMDYSNVELFDEYLAKSDILYIGGGMSDDLVKYFLDNNLDKILIKYLSSDKIYAGVSAGAMLYTKVSLGDKYMYYDNFHNYNYKMVNCLGILNISICPHFQNEDLICYNDIIKEYGLVSFGIEEDCCLVIDDTKYYIFKETKSNSVYYFNNNDYLMEDLREGLVYEKIGGFRS